MSFESRPSWDTNISSVGGAKDILLVSSPWSDLPSDNCRQGTLTSGVLNKEFAPPVIDIEPASTGAYYQNRMNTSDINQRVALMNRQTTTSNLDQAQVNKQVETYVGPSRRSVKRFINPSRQGSTTEQQDLAVGESREKYNPGIPGLVDSHLHQESFTQEESSNLIVLLLAIISFCVVGMCAGMIIPYVYTKSAPNTYD